MLLYKKIVKKNKNKNSGHNQVSCYFTLLNITLGFPFFDYINNNLQLLLFQKPARKGKEIQINRRLLENELMGGILCVVSNNPSKQ
jgi:hypothetical protein